MRGTSNGAVALAPVVDASAAVQTGRQDVPLEPIVVHSAKVVAG